MHFNDEELEVIFLALKMNYLDGPNSEQLEELLYTIAKHLGKTDGL